MLHNPALEAPRRPVRIAVADPLPMFNLGVEEAMKGIGYVVEVPDDLLTWAMDNGPHVILLTLLRPADWTLLTELHDDRPGRVIVAVMENDDPIRSVRALTAGASGVMARDADTDTVRLVLRAAAAGRSLLPISVVRVLASSNRGAAAEVRTPTATDIDWIRLLARGETVARLADHAGYSERMMFRLLRDLYRRWGVANRTEAIVYARGQNWL